MSMEQLIALAEERFDTLHAYLKRCMFAAGE